jgi:ribonuclease BN (tRNA processing enzyme)
MSFMSTLPEIDDSLENIITHILSGDRRVLLSGQPGVGKSTLAANLAQTIWETGRHAWCIDADPGSPTFGIPGAVCRGQWDERDWVLADVEALCSLDAGRFRLPLLSAVRALAERDIHGVLFIDTPGVVRGVAGAELFGGLIEAAKVDLILAIIRPEQPRLLSNELNAAGVETIVVTASPDAHRAGKRQRTRRRTHAWDAYLSHAEEYTLPLSSTQLVGTPPPLDVPSAWIGRQIAWLKGTRTAAMGEILDREADSLRVRMPRKPMRPSVLLIRDALRTEDGSLTTAKPFASTTHRYLPPPDVRPYTGSKNAGGPHPVARVGMAIGTLVNGTFGDPLLHVRLRHLKRSLLFDLGEGGRLPGRIAHQVRDVFISHAHIDHIAGFLWLLRARIGEFPTCRLYGPPGLAGHIAGLMSGILWDRIGENGPRFSIAELHNDCLMRYAIQAGRSGVEQLGERRVMEGVILEEPAFRVRAATLDHGTPVLAFAFEQPRQFNIRKERLIARGLPAGPWLNELKLRLAKDEFYALIDLPDGSSGSAGELADDLVLIAPGQKLVYATDLADSIDNRQRLIALARGAHTLFCEAAFVEADKNQAVRTGHLTGRACGEIATCAKVGHLIPFHFSRRYETAPEPLYEEVRSVCSRVVVPCHVPGGQF